MKMRHAVACLALVSCAKIKTEAPADASPPVASASAAPAAASVDTTTLPRPPTPRDDARNVVLRWSSALDKHDLDTLEKVYAARVDLYGTTVPKSAAIDAKRKAFKATPTFRQSIVGGVALEKKGSEWIATFTKHSGPEASQKDANAKVVLAPGDGGALVVTVETDVASEKKAAAAGSCEGVAGKAVQDLPEVKKLLASDEKALGKDDHMGGMGPDPEPGGGFTAALGVHHPDRFESQVVYGVDAKGKLTVTVMGEDVAVPPATSAAVGKACAK